MEGYQLYRKEGRTAVVLICEDDDELYYLLNKLRKGRGPKPLKQFADRMVEDFFDKSTRDDPEPPVDTISSGDN